MPKNPAKRKSRWKPAPANAIQLAALHWYALTIEQMAIEAYATNPGKFAALDQYLRGVLKDMRRIADQTIDDGDCPDGWIRCSDGLCSPACLDAL